MRIDEYRGLVSKALERWSSLKPEIRAEVTYAILMAAEGDGMPLLDEAMGIPPPSDEEAGGMVQ